MSCGSYVDGFGHALKAEECMEVSRAVRDVCVVHKLEAFSVQVRSQGHAHARHAHTHIHAATEDGVAEAWDQKKAAAVSGEGGARGAGEHVQTGSWLEVIL